MVTSSVAVLAALLAQPLRVGLLLPTTGEGAALAAAAEQGLRLGLEEMGDSARVEVVVVRDDLPWAGSAARLARLIYDENVLAIVGSLDGRSAHLAAQVVTRAKGRAVFITPWASDPTVTQVRIPWIARTVPDDVRQSQRLAAALVERRLCVLVQDGDYDARQALRAFVKEAAPSCIIPYGGAGSPLPELRRAAPQAIVLLGDPARAGRELQALRSAGIHAPVFGFLRLATPLFKTEAGGQPGDVLLIGPAPDPAKAAFERRYRARHGRAPWPIAWYSYAAGRAALDALSASPRPRLVTTSPAAGARLALIPLVDLDAP